MTQADKVLDLLDQRATKVVPRRGIYVGLGDVGSAIVDLGTNRVQADFVGGIVPEIGEPVHVWTVDSELYMLGPTRAKPGQGTVVSVTGSYAKINTIVGELTMPYVGSAPAVSARVGILWSQGPICIGTLSTTPPPPPPPPAPGPTGPTVRTAVFQAIDTGSTDRPAERWWTPEVYASNTTYGAWFYGSQIKDTIPAGATLVSLEFYASRRRSGGAAPRFVLHSLATKSGLPVLSAYTEWNPADGFQSVPMAQAWFDGLKQGGTAWGVGLNQGGYNIFNSRNADAMSGALRISWKA